MPKINVVSPLAKKIGFKIGDDVIKIGGYPMLDNLDYLFFDNQKKFEVELIRNNKTKKIKVKKKDGQSLGIEFDIEMQPRRCKNHCIFCFVDQLPKGMRESLYVKDDDYRYSFMCGSYITLTNITDEDIERIIRLKLSPLYISVHAFDDDLRLKMVRNPNTLKLKKYIKLLGDNGIKMHTQIVVVPNVNDKQHLENSIIGLSQMKGVQSIAVVPVGMTKYRENLDKLKPISVDDAKETIKLVEKLHCQTNGLCWCSDEYYVKANLNVKNYSYYKDFEQIENGVGLIADFEDNLDFAINEIESYKLNKTIAFATGTSFGNLLPKYLNQVENKLGIECNVYKIKNDFFGHSVTVAGLVTASDISNQLKEISADALVIPDNMLREFTDTFLDNITLKELEEKINMPIIVVAHNGSDLPNKIIEHFVKG